MAQPRPDRRHFPRIDTPVIVEFANPDNKQDERSYTQNLSEEGTRFPTRVKFDVGQEIHMRLQIPPSSTTIHATGQVMWVREVARITTPQYEVGVRFRWSEDPDHAALHHHLAGLFPRKV